MVEITLALGDYDRTRPLMDGRVEIEGCEPTFLRLEPEEIFFRVFRNQEFDVSEISFSSYMMQTSRGESAYVGIPAFISRVFRHSSIFIRTDRGIRTPGDLKGKLIGVPEYQQTALVWIRGILKDEYGIDPSEMRFRNGGMEEPGRDERVQLRLPKEIDISPIPPGETLSNMLVEGNLDAIFAAREPSCFVNGSPNIGRLFPNYREVEKEYFKKTRIFPIMHLVGIRTSLVDKYPWLPASVYKAFVHARTIAMGELPTLSALNVMLPWGEAEKMDAIAVMGNDFWKYGVVESKHEIETLARYSYEQGLSTRKLSIDELFAKSTLDVSRI